jgi:pyruvate dehydrogenase (quinone)
VSQTVSEVIVEALVAAGARRCYGIVGDTINHFTDAVRRSGLHWVQVRHEEAGALAAGGESYLTGELSLCAGTAGPGSLHFLNGIYESHRNGAPVVMIASQIARTEAGLDYPQEVDQRRLYEECSVFCETVSHPDQARRIAVQAAQAALTRHGVAVIVVAGDMFRESVGEDRPWSVHRPRPVIRPADDELQALAGMIGEARRIAIYGGIGCREAHDEVVALAERLRAPVAHSSRAKEFLAHDNPFDVGMTGILGNRAGMRAVADCDLLLCLGTDFAYTQFYPDKAKIAQIDIEPTHIGRRSPVDLGLVGDVGDSLRALLPLLDQREDETFLDTARRAYAHDLETLAERGAEPDPELVHPQYVAQTLDRLAAPDAAFTADGGSPMVWLLRHVAANGRRSFLLSLLHGTMANAYPQAIGIAHAYPDRQVIAMCGDGGLAMLLGDLLTLAQQKLPVKLLVFDNGALGFVELEQKVEGLLDSYTGLDNPDFGALARACGLHGATVERADDLEPAMRDWLAADGPALLAVKVSRMELVMPPETEPAQVASTGLYGLKAVLNGRLDDLVALFRDNFWR